jgi:uncharacterized membrane protein
MLYSLIAGSAAGQRILDWIEAAALAIEVLAVCVIVFAIVHAFVRYSVQVVRQREVEGHFRQLKMHLARALLLGLEILVAADIVRTVALEATLQSVAVLGLLVLIRTFLSWALVVEIEGRWPWQPRSEENRLN